MVAEWVEALNHNVFRLQNLIQTIAFKTYQHRGRRRIHLTEIAFQLSLLVLVHHRHQFCPQTVALRHIAQALKTQLCGRNQFIRQSHVLRQMHLAQIRFHRPLAHFCLPVIPTRLNLSIGIALEILIHKRLHRIIVIIRDLHLPIVQHPLIQRRAGIKQISICITSAFKQRILVGHLLLLLLLQLLRLQQPQFRHRRQISARTSRQFDFFNFRNARSQLAFTLTPTLGRDAHHLHGRSAQMLVRQHIRTLTHDVIMRVLFLKRNHRTTGKLHQQQAQQ